MSSSSPRSTHGGDDESAASTDANTRGLVALFTLPFAAALVVGLHGLHLLLVAFGNITDPDANFAFVQHVLSMDTTNFGQPAGTGPDADGMWRSITSPSLHRAAYGLIVGWEALTSVVLLTAFACWIRERGTSFRMARALSTLGLSMQLLLFMGGFIAIGGEWFQMWKSTAWNGLESAFRNSVLGLAALLLVHMPSEYWQRPNIRSPRR